MGDRVVSVSGLSKSYRIGSDQGRGSRTFREAVVDLAMGPLARIRGGGAGACTEEFWALRGVEFDIADGEVVGVVGRNGAGKSTLLKILSGITPPSCGRVELKGRVGSLLEVGTGFHQELTGRENVFLNGAILGMRRREIEKKFDAIVDYSGVEKFLNTPVKRYSSGMRVRLAFAVAAFLEPEILIVDEVLAVGDIEFQKKCLGTMSNVAASGRTVLFVSHNMAAVSALCSRTIVLSDGNVTFDGDTASGVSHYNSLADGDNENSTLPQKISGYTVEQFALVDKQQGSITRRLTMGENCNLQISVDVHNKSPEQHLLIILTRKSDRLRVASITTREIPYGALTAGRHNLNCEISSGCLLPGEYNWTLQFVDPSGICGEVSGLAPFSIEETILPGASHAFKQAHGVCLVSTSIERLPAATAAPDTLTHERSAA
jgi:lipopolysaccharide transport system ATP-binding protein